MARTINFLLVGTGGISAAYVNASSRVDDIIISGVVSRSGRLPDALRSDTPVYRSIEEADCPADAVILATPNGTHLELIEQAAAKQMHILVEKVLETTPDRANRALEICDKAGLKLSVSFQRRMSPDNSTLKRLLEKGVLGQTYAASMDVRFHRDMAYYNSGSYRGGWDIDGGGPFIQQAAHNADLLCWWFGLPEKVASLLHRHDRDIEAYDHGTALLQYSSGLQINFTASTLCKPGFPTRFELHTEKGSLLMVNDQFTDWNIEGIENPADQSFEVHDGAASATVSDTAGHEAILADFADALRHDRDPLILGSSARQATELIYRIYQNNLNPQFETPFQT